jgi:hypothetical protein
MFEAVLVEMRMVAAYTPHLTRQDKRVEARGEER